MASNTARPEAEKPPVRETESGLDENVAATVSYVLGFLTGIVMYLVESENEHVRFHAVQSVVVFGTIFAISIALNFFQIVVGFDNIVGWLLGAILSLVSLLLWLGALVVWAYLVIRTYQGNDPRLPVAAGIADNYV